METKTSEIGGALAALSSDLAGAVERAGRSVVAVDARPRTPSSGTYWREGVVVTADHTVKRDQEIKVAFSDGRSVDARLAGRDPSTDLAVLKVPVKQAPAAEIGEAASLKVGHLVLAVGRGGDVGLAASLGVVSALGDTWQTWRGGQIDRFIRLDLSIFLGFSGGPLVDPRGRVLGINTTGLWRGMGMAVPASTVDRVTNELLEKGRVARAYLGLGMQPVRLPDALQSKLNLPGKGGMIVVTVESGGPAERAGAMIGDVLVAFDGKPVNDIGHVRDFLGAERVGKSVKGSFLRAGALVELAITLGDRSSTEGQ